LKPKSRAAKEQKAQKNLEAERH
jgi:hypothetical protein